MQDLDEFERQLEKLIGRPTNMRPFVCEGSPLRCRVFIVGFNPATTMEASFWDFWRSGYGFDKKAWFEAYKKERRSRPLKPGKRRRNPVSNTRRVIDWITEAAAPCECLETNIYSLPSEDQGGLAQEGRNIAPFKFLLKSIMPSVIVAHGNELGGKSTGLRRLHIHVVSNTSPGDGPKRQHVHWVRNSKPACTTTD